MQKIKKNMTIFIIVIFLFIFPYLLSLLQYECPYKKFFNIYCPGCGATRMLESLFKLEFYQAFRYNPLMFIITILLPIYLIIDIIYYVKNKKFLKITKKQIIIFFIVMLVYFVIRNLKIGSYLIPTEI